MIKQKGLVLVFALLVLLSITILGVSSVSSSLLQTKMATSLERKSVAFDAAETALAGAVFESEDTTILDNPALTDPLSEARALPAIDLTVDDLSCFDNNRVRREVTSAGMTFSTVHNAPAQFSSQGDVNSWSQSAFIRTQACRGSSNVVSGSNVQCHVFILRGCGQAQGSPYAVANTMTASIFAPAAN
jgi:type IV pilus assembly protein PilX